MHAICAHVDVPFLSSVGSACGGEFILFYFPFVFELHPLLSACNRGSCVRPVLLSCRLCLCCRILLFFSCVLNSVSSRMHAISPDVYVLFLSPVGSASTAEFFFFSLTFLNSVNSRVHAISPDVYVPFLCPVGSASVAKFLFFFFYF